jgi:hypothetical protein
MNDEKYNFSFSIKDNQLMIDGKNSNQLYQLNKQQNCGNGNSNCNKVILKEKKKNDNSQKKKTRKLSIFNIKKKQKKSKAQNLIKQTNVRCQKGEDLN